MPRSTLLCTQARSLADDGLTVIAGKIYEEVLKEDPAEAEALFGLGLLYAHRDMPRALAYLHRSLRLDPDAPIRWHHYGVFLASHHGLDDRALRARKIAAILDPGEIAYRPPVAARQADPQRRRATRLERWPSVAEDSAISAALPLLRPTMVAARTPMRVTVPSLA